MATIVKPAIAVDTIQLQADPNAPDQTDSILANWGPNMPVVRVNDYVLAAGELISFDIKVRANTVPSFTLEVEDMNYTVRAALNLTVVDTGVIFIGYQKWYIKFNALMTVVSSDAGDHAITITGVMYNPALHQTYQGGYSQKTVTDILTDIAQRTQMGLFTVPGPKLSQVLDTCVNANRSALEFFDFVMTAYTDCLWCVDPFYIFHVVDYSQMKQQPLDTYTMNVLTGVPSNPPLPMILSTALWPGDDPTDSQKLRVKWYTINTNFGQAHLANALKYSTFFEGRGTTEVDTDTTQQFGMGDRTANSFYGFESQYFPYHGEVINKLIAGKSITAYMENIVFEITPFSVVKFEAWLPKQNANDTVMDPVNSGVKVVIGYGFTFDKRESNTKYPIVRQTIDLI